MTQTRKEREKSTPNSQFDLRARVIHVHVYVSLSFPLYLTFATNFSPPFSPPYRHTLYVWVFVLWLCQCELLFNATKSKVVGIFVTNTLYTRFFKYTFQFVLVFESMLFSWHCCWLYCCYKMHGKNDLANTRFFIVCTRCLVNFSSYFFFFLFSLFFPSELSLLHFDVWRVLYSLPPLSLSQLSPRTWFPSQLLQHSFHTFIIFHQCRCQFANDFAP